MKKTDKKYAIMALCMCFFLVGTLILIEQQVGIHLFAAAVFCLACSGVLLFCLMKLDVMDFQQGTFWYRLNQAINQKNAPKAGRVQQHTYCALPQGTGHRSVYRKIA